MHVGLNLIFLVPGETGGMEVVARELIPALAAAAPPGMRFTAFVNREAAGERDAPWGQAVPAVTVPPSCSATWRTIARPRPEPGRPRASAQHLRGSRPAHEPVAA